MGRSAGGDRLVEARLGSHGRSSDLFSAGALRQVQGAADYRIHSRSSTEDRNRKDTQADTQRKVLGGQGETGPRVISIFLSVEESAKDQVIAELWESGTTGITEQNESLRAFFGDDADASELMDRFAAYDPQVITEEE